MFSQTVEYALRVVVHLARTAPNPQTTKQIGEATMVPVAYLSKVIQKLVRGKILHSQRGMGGGVSLIPDPTEISLLDVVNELEPIVRIETCPLGFSKHGNNLCAVHAQMDTALGLVEEALKKSTIAELLVESNSSLPLCRQDKPVPLSTIDIISK